MKLLPGTFSLKDLIDLSKDPRSRVASTPWGAERGKAQLYVGRSVPWKGLRGTAFFAEAARHGRLADAVKAIAQFSRNHAGIRGRAEVATPIGVIQMPLKSAKQMQAVGKVDAGDITAIPSMRLPGVSLGQLSGLRAT